MDTIVCIYLDQQFPPGLYGVSERACVSCSNPAAIVGGELIQSAVVVVT